MDFEALINGSNKTRPGGETPSQSWGKRLAGERLANTRAGSHRSVPPLRLYLGSAFNKSSNILSSSLFSSDCEGESKAFARLLLSVTTNLGSAVA